MIWLTQNLQTYAYQFLEEKTLAIIKNCLAFMLGIEIDIKKIMLRIISDFKSNKL